MKQNNLKKGFTLVELLVVITILAILGTMGANLYTGQIAKTRDSVRENDLRVIETALTLYEQENYMFPNVKDLNNTNFSELVKNGLPSDPKSGAQCVANGNVKSVCDYTYEVANAKIQNDSYRLSTGFENDSNVKNKAAKDNGTDTARYELSNNLNGKRANGNAIWTGNILALNGATGGAARTCSDVNTTTNATNIVKGVIRNGKTCSN